MPELKRSPDRERLLDAVRQIAPTLEACAAEAEAMRRLPQPAVDAMLAADLFRCGAPREVGGLEADPVTQTEVFEAVTAVESNSGWNLMIGAIWSVWLGSRLPDEGAAALYNADAWPIVAGLIWPYGHARPDGEAAYKVTGRWKFGSGIHQAAWVASGCQIIEGGGPRLAPNGMPINLITVVPQAQVTIHDTWHTAGLRGTGSNDYSVEDRDVSAGFTMMPIGGPVLRGGAWWRLPALFLAAPGHSGFALGIAKRCLDEVKHLGDRRRYVSPSRQAERESVQMELGRRMAEYEAVRLFVMNHYADCIVKGERGEVPLGRPVNAYATEMAVRCAEFAYKVMGGESVYESSPVQRYLRDILAAQQHVAASDATFALYGRAALEAAATST